MQEKMDGVRQIVECRAGSVTAGNRNGLTVAVSAAIVEAVLALDHDCVLDGEAIGDVYWPFDLLSFDGTRHHPPFARPTASNSSPPCSRPDRRKPWVGSAPHFQNDEKHALLNTIRAERGEGVVFKNANARYAPGRPASGGDALKHKFKASATCAVVSHRSGKRSVQVAVSQRHCERLNPSTAHRDRQCHHSRGANSVPPVDSVIEVEYFP